MRFRIQRAFGAAAAGVALFAPGLACASTPAASGKVLPVVARPLPGYQLNGVAATSASNAWAVGCTVDNCAANASKTLILHWNGRTWRRQASPTPSRFSGLFAVAALSASDAWAVGNAGVRILILHWNGTAWDQVPGPHLPVHSASLHGVAALSASDAWAVGSADAGSLILHWNGTAWKRVPSPGGGWSAVAAQSARSAWAAGQFTRNGATGAAAAHWDGTAWTQLPSPARPSRRAGPSYFTGVAVVAARSAWAVGRTGYGKTLIAQWNGTAWKQVPSPTPVGPGGLDGVAAISAADAWAVGSTCTPHCAGIATLILRWNGTSWTRVPSPSPGIAASPESQLLGVTATSPANAWAAGFECVRPAPGASGCESVGEQNAALILHWNGTRWTQVPVRA